MNAPLIATRGLYKRFGAVVAVDNVTVEIAPGETVGVIGANGAGKTTFVNIVTGYLKPDEGIILFRGVDITPMSAREVTRLGIRRSFQMPQLFPNLSVRDNALVALACAEQARPTPTTILRTPARLTQANRILARLDSEFRYEAAILRHVADAEARTRVRRSRAQVFIKKFHLAGADSQESHDCAHERCLTGAIAADEPDERARRDRQNDIRQHRQACDLDRKVSNVEGPAHARTPSARRCSSAPTT